MLNLPEAIVPHCPNVEPARVERHLRRMPASYAERYAVTEIARHMRLLAEVSAAEPLALEVAALGRGVFEIVVVCVDYPGTIACITTALAADHFDLEDLHISTYTGASDPTAPDEPDCSVILLRVSGSTEDTPEDLTEQLHDRLRGAFVHLAAGHFPEAQAAAAIRYDPHRHSPIVKAVVGLELGGDYRLNKRLARGGMSEVYLATQLSLNRTVAVKVARHQGGTDDEMAARFTREALVLGQFQCPYIVPVFAAGTLPSGDGVLGWIAMEYQAGGDLARWVAQHGPAPVELGLRWFRQAIEGLRYAHNNGVLHRDVKPHNLLLTTEGNVKLGDFGLFKFMDADPTISGTRNPVRGTPHYMAPEQARGEHLDERSDIFSLGTTFFHLFTGRLAFDAATPGEVLLLISKGEVPRVAEIASELPKPLAVLLGRMLAPEPEERYQAVSVLLDDLASYEARGLLTASDTGTFPATADGEAGVGTMPAGLETAPYLPSLSSDPALGSN
ncbi:MAG: protein kinase domain-containing protein [Gemmataceae bacterium]